MIPVDSQPYLESSRLYRAVGGYPVKGDRPPKACVKETSKSILRELRPTTPQGLCRDLSSIHLLANDAGCAWRHSYDPKTGVVSPFRSGYVDRPWKPGDLSDLASSDR